MNITLINHASVLFEWNEVRLLTDPWIEGTVFHDGWKLLSKTPFDYNDFEKITHIWFSHEHPDHFFPPNIRQIPASIRQNISILYQETKDKKVVEFCEKLGFKKVIELKQNQFYTLGKDFKILCNPYGHDSWLYLKTSQKSILNTNDCVIDNYLRALPIKRRVGIVDVLLTQFSYAQYEGNPDQPDRLKKAAKRKLDQISTQIKVFKPRFLIPFASFVWFCHEENSYMNKHINTIETIYDYFQPKINTVVLYPGKKWTIDEAYESSTHLEAYKKDYAAIDHKTNLLQATLVPFETLSKEAVSFIEKAKVNIPTAVQQKYLFPLYIHLVDLNLKCSLSNDYLKQVEDASEMDVSMSSEVLNYCLKFDWGFDTTLVNGRMRVISSNGYQKLVHYEKIGNSLNHEQDYTQMRPSWFQRLKNYLNRF